MRERKPVVWGTRYGMHCSGWRYDAAAKHATLLDYAYYTLYLTLYFKLYSINSIMYNIKQY